MRALVVLFALLLGCGAEPPRSRSAARGASSVASACPPGRVAVRVLGSGGPIVDDARASTGYLLLVDGRPRLLVDAGSGVALRLGELGVAPESLDGWLVSHVHVDHSADLVALLKSASFSTRRHPLPIGPSGNDRFPALDRFVRAQVGVHGAWSYLGDFLEGRPFALDLQETDVDGGPTSVMLGDLRIEAVGVPHGPVPALGFVVHAAGRRIAFGGDQRLDDPRFLELARDVDLMVAHHAVPESNAGIAARLHARPSQIGAFAAEAGVQTLVLSHHMQRSLERWAEGEAAVRSRFHGRLFLAEDLDCFAVGD